MILIAACQTIPVEDREPIRQQTRDHSSETIEKLVGKKPELQEKLDDSAGYFFGLEIPVQILNRLDTVILGAMLSPKNGYL